MKKIFITLAIPLLFFLGSCSAPDQQTSDIASVSADSAEKTDSFNAGQYDKIKLTYLEMALGHTGGWTKTRTEKAFGEPASEETVALYDVTADVLTYQRGTPF